jgi:hypothetical protein
VTGIHIYCIAPASHFPAPELTGLDGAALRAADAAGLSFWFSAHAARPDASLDRVRVHNDVARAAMTTLVTPVPVRFGQWFDDTAAAAAKVAENVEHWRERLTHFAGRAEYGVRVLPLHDEPHSARDVHPAPASSGRAYMEALAQRQAEAERMRSTAEELAVTLSAQLSDLIADSRADLCPDSRTVLSMAHLVAWRDAEAYHSRMQSVRAAHTELRLLFSGPWPPYSFVA